MNSGKWGLRKQRSPSKLEKQKTQVILIVRIAPWGLSMAPRWVSAWQASHCYGRSSSWYLREWKSTDFWGRNPVKWLGFLVGYFWKSSSGWLRNPGWRKGEKVEVANFSIAKDCHANHPFHMEWKHDPGTISITPPQKLTWNPKTGLPPLKLNIDTQNIHIWKDIHVWSHDFWYPCEISGV